MIVDSQRQINNGHITIPKQQDITDEEIRFIIGAVLNSLLCKRNWFMHRRSSTHDLYKDTLAKCRSKQSQERTAGKIAIVQISSAKAPKDKERDEANSKAMDHEN
jgi:hypothetical protein